MLKSFVPLRLKGDHSFGSAVGSPTEYVARAASLGVRAMALTDVGSLAAQMEFHAACRAAGIKPVTGVEFVFRAASGADGCLVLLAQDERGYARLCHLATERAARRRARAPSPLEDVDLAGVFALTDSPALAARLVEQGNERGRVALLLTRPARDGAREARVREAAGRLGVRLVADLDVVMPAEGDAALLSLSAAVRARGGRAGAANDGRPGFLDGSAEALFADVPDALRMTRRIADACELVLGTPQSARLGGDAHGAMTELRRRCATETADAPLRRERLQAEFAVIEELGLADYFLAVSDVADEARRRNIGLAARGSAVSSYVVHRLGLSTLDPIALGFYFERFVRLSRRDPPDIDLDVASDRREELLGWVQQRFGKDRVSPVGAYQTFGRRFAYRDALAALGMRPAEVNRFSAAMPEDELELPAPVQLLPASLRRQAPLIERLVGRPRHLATHPSAIAISGRSLRDFTPLVPAPKGVLVTQLDGEALGRLGLLKLDLLGNRALAELAEVGCTTGENPAAWPESDAETLGAIGRAETIGCNQLETPAVRSVLRRMRIASIEDVTAALALVRPGASSGRAKDAFVRRVRGQEAASFLDERLRRALSSTHGVLLYEEDVIRVVETVTGCSPAEADEIRAAIVRGDATLRDFEARTSRRGFAPEVVQAVWEDLDRFAAYSFSKAHAASMARLAYRTAYARQHHPTAFACAVLNHHLGIYPLRTVAADFVRSGVALRGPDVEASELASVTVGGGVLIGLAALKVVSRATKHHVLEERAARGPFQTMADFLRRVPLGRNELSALVLSGACDALEPLSKAAYPFAHEAFLAGSDPSRVEVRARHGPEHLELYRALVRVKNELRFLEMHPSHHPMALLRPEATRSGCIAVRELPGREGRRARLAVIVAALRRVRTSAGRIVEFVTLEDETGVAEALVASPIYERLGDPIRSPGPYLVEGAVADDLEHVALYVDSVRPFHLRERPYAA